MAILLSSKILRNSSAPASVKYILTIRMIIKVSCECCFNLPTQVEASKKQKNSFVKLCAPLCNWIFVINSTPTSLFKNNIHHTIITQPQQFRSVALKNPDLKKILTVKNNKDLAHLCLII